MSFCANTLGSSYDCMQNYGSFCSFLIVFTQAPSHTASSQQGVNTKSKPNQLTSATAPSRDVSAQVRSITQVRTIASLRTAFFKNVMSLASMEHLIQLALRRAHDARSCKK
eukprot:1857239-Amphidinium_carterae.1